MMRAGFITPIVVLLLLVFTLAIGTMTTSVTAHVKVTGPRVSYRGQSDAAHIGIKLAEDWLLSSIDAGAVPLGGGRASGSPFERVEAVRPDGGRAVGDGGFSGFDIELYVADTDYNAGLFSAPGTAKSSIPRMPAVSTPEGVRRFYFLRSTATLPGRRNCLISEELLSVSIDRSGAILETTRLFYRSLSSVR